MDRHENIVTYSNKIVELIKRFSEQNKWSIDSGLIKDLQQLITETLEYKLKRTSVCSTSLVPFLISSIELAQNQILLQKEPVDEHILRMKEIVDNNELLSDISRNLQTNYFHCVKTISDHFPHLDMYFNKRMKFTIENHEGCLYDSTGEKEIKEDFDLLSHSDATEKKRDTSR